MSLITQGIHGTSKFLAPTPAGFIAAAGFYDFAPAPCSLISCCVPDTQRKRQYAHIYENRVEINYPVAPCCCLTLDEKCVIDRIWVSHFDKQPSRVGMCCGCIPATCCGPPVLFAFRPKFCCIDMSDCCGIQIRAAPCDCYGLKQCICCCNPCYVTCSQPLLFGVKEPQSFLSAWKFALAHYAGPRGLGAAEMAIFQDVEDNVFDFGKAKGVQTAEVQAVLVEGRTAVAVPMGAPVETAMTRQ